MKQWICKAWEMPSVKTDPPSERFLKIIFSPEMDGYDQATVLFSYLPAGHSSGRHSHPDCDEIMYFQGRGRATLGDTEVPVEDGLVILAPKGVPHEAVNTSDTETMKVFCVYIPPLKPAPIHQKGIELGRKKKLELGRLEQP